MTTDHNYDLVQTRDGTCTLHSGEYGETMHSVSGAYEEALLKHVRPSGIVDSAAANKYVLDVGFGLGYNILALLAEFIEKNSGGNIYIFSLEKDRSLISMMDRIVFNDERDDIYALIKRAYAHCSAQNENIEIRVMLGDGRDTIKNISGVLIDAVFFDPYSPSKNPELWSVEFFQETYRLMSDTGILTTYSSALQIRMALVEAGFIIGRGPAVGGKRGGKNKDY
jgi:chorismate dehydratase